MRRESHVILRPMMPHERRHQPAMLFGNVAIEEGPDMIAAYRPRLDQPYIEIGTLRRQRQRRQAASEPASDDRNIAFICGSPGHNPALAVPALRRKAIALGATYREAQVTDVQRQGRRVSSVRLASGESIGCGTLINAAGTGASAVARAAGIDTLPIESRKRSVFYVTSPARLPGCPMVIDPSGAYFRPEGQGFICGISPPAEQDPECFDFDVQHALFDELLWPLLAARVPGFEALRVQRAWAGHYDVNTLDHNLIIGAHPEVENLLFANGFSGHGLQQSPAVGRALSELVTFGCYRTLDLSVFGWQRVLEGRPVLELNVV